MRGKHSSSRTGRLQGAAQSCAACAGWPCVGIKFASTVAELVWTAQLQSAHPHAHAQREAARNAGGDDNYTVHDDSIRKCHKWCEMKQCSNAITVITKICKSDENAVFFCISAGGAAPPPRHLCQTWRPATRRHWSVPVPVQTHAIAAPNPAPAAAPCS